jgi:hypothetical protein
MSMQISYSIVDGGSAASIEAFDGSLKTGHGVIDFVDLFTAFKLRPGIAIAPFRELPHLHSASQSRLHRAGSKPSVRRGRACL